MTERATINQVTQLGVETTPGVAVAATRRLQALTISPAVRAEVQHYRPSGGKFSVIQALGKEWSEAGIAGPATYTEIVYLLAGALAYAAPAQQGTSAAYLWTFTPPQAGASTIRTYTIEMGDAVRAHRMTYGLVNALAVRGDRSSVELSGSIVGRAIEDGVTPTPGATAVELVPVLPTQVSGYVDNAHTSIGTTKLNRLLRWEWELGDRFSTVWPVDAAQTSFVTHVESEPTARLKLLLEADAQGMALLSAMRSGAKRFVRIRCEGGVADATYNYALTFDVCGTVEDVSEFSDEEGVYAIEWTLRATYDDAWGRALEVSAVNRMSAL